ncbi:gp24 [Streptococcus pneumoniae]|nr:gp24 [Streptococcus pneumoniae]
MTQTLEEGMKNQSKCIKVPREIRPFDIGYRIVNKYGQALALRNGASIFDLPFLAEKAIEKEFGKNDPKSKEFDDWIGYSPSMAQVVIAVYLIYRGN